jgi:hypothetical protein
VRGLDESVKWIRDQIRAGRSDANIVRHLFQKGLGEAEIVELGQRVGREFDPDLAYKYRRKIPPLTRARIIRSAGGGALLIGGLGLARVPFTSSDSIAPIGGALGYVAFCVLWGGLCGIIFAVSTPWRYAGGMRRWMAYGLMGAVAGIIIFTVLAVDGLLAGEPLGTWVITLLGTIAISTVALNISRKWYETIGVV